MALFKLGMVKYDSSHYILQVPTDTHLVRLPVPPQWLLSALSMSVWFKKLLNSIQSGYA